MEGSGGMLRCQICDRLFQNHASLQRHIEEHIAHQLYVCNLCGTQCLSSEALDGHQCSGSSTEDPQDYACGECGEMYETEEELRGHACSAFNAARSVVKYVCGDCRGEFDSSAALEKHIYQCAGKRFPYTNAVNTEQQGGWQRMDNAWQHSGGHNVQTSVHAGASTREVVRYSSTRRPGRVAASVGGHNTQASVHAGASTREVVRYSGTRRPGSITASGGVSGELVPINQISGNSSVVHNRHNFQPNQNTISNVTLRSGVMNPRYGNGRISSLYADAVAVDCMVCGKRFGDAFYLATHMKRHHELSRSDGNSACICQVCGKICDSATELSMHLQTHKEEKRGKPSDAPLDLSVKKITLKAIMPPDNVSRTNTYITQTIPAIEHRRQNSYAAQTKTTVQHHEDNTGSDNLQIETTVKTVTQPDSTDAANSYIGKVKSNSDVAQTTTTVKHHEDDIDTTDSLQIALISSSPEYTKEQYATSQHQCNICDKTFTTESGLQQHMKVHYCSLLYQCKTCPKCFFSKNEYKAHKETCTDSAARGKERFDRRSTDAAINDSKTDPDTDDEIGSDGNDDVIHPPPLIGDVEDIETFDDDFTDEYNSSLNTLSKSRSIDEPDLYMCDICPESFSSAVSLRIHRKIHCGRPPFECEWCNNSYSTAKGLWKHFVHYHERGYTPERFTNTADEEGVSMYDPKRAASMSYKFTSSAESANDYDGYDIENPRTATAAPCPELWQCAHCAKYFYSQKSLQLHRKLHEGGDSPIELYTTTDTDRASNPSRKERELDSEERSQSPRAHAFRCQYCKLTFKTKQILVCHRRSHGKNWKTKSKKGTHPKSAYSKNGILPHKCDVCEKSFISAHSLTIHRTTHESEDAEAKDHACAICKKDFKRKIALTRHIRLHHRRMRCKICGAVFSSAVALRIHKRGHIGRGTYSCNKCPMSYHTEASLDHHTQTQHGDVTHSRPSTEDPSSPESDSDGMDGFSSGAYREVATVKQEPSEFSGFATEEPPGGRYECPACGRGFSGSKGLNIHLSLKHCSPPKMRHSDDNSGDEESAHECEGCKSSFESRRGLSIHKFYCSSIGLRGKTTPENSNKENDETDESSRTCEYCFKILPTTRGRKIHVTYCVARPEDDAHKEAPPVYEHKCGKCSASFPTSRGLSNHSRHCKGGGKGGTPRKSPSGRHEFKCSLCSKICANARGLEVHMFHHSAIDRKDDFSGKVSAKSVNEGVYKCVACGDRFATLQGFKIHHGHQHPTSTQFDLTILKENPSPEKNGSVSVKSESLHTCSVCGKGFETREALKTHNYYVHSMQDKMSPKSSTHSANETSPRSSEHQVERFNEERPSHGLKRPFRCLQCFKRFPTIHGLRIHRFQHQKFKCGACKMGFSTERGLNLHRYARHGAASLPDRESPVKKRRLPVISGVGLPFKCDHCEKSFLTLGSLRGHCNKKQHPFRNPDELPSFEKSRKPMPAKCEQCGKTFKSSRAMHIHWSRTGKACKPTRDPPKPPAVKKHIIPEEQHAFVPFSDMEEMPEVDLHFSPDVIKSPSHHKRDTTPPPQHLNCRRCDRVFSSSRALKVHWIKTSNRCKSKEATSRPKKRYSCTVCGLGLSGLSALHLHRAKHHKYANISRVEPRSPSDGPRYSCDICHDNFASKKGRDLHRIMKHMQMKQQDDDDETPSSPKITSPIKNPYKCAICESSFSSATDLHTHVESHSSSPSTLGSPTKQKGPRTCRICLNTFASVSNMKRHMVAIHGAGKCYASPDPY